MRIEFTPERMKYIKAIYGAQADSLNESQLENIYNTPIEHLKTAADQKTEAKQVQDLAMNRGPETVTGFAANQDLAHKVIAPSNINPFQDALKGAKNFKDANRIALQYKQNQFTWKGKPIATWAKDGSKQLANFSKPNAGYVKPRVAAPNNATPNTGSRDMNDVHVTDSAVVTAPSLKTIGENAYNSREKFLTSKLYSDEVNRIDKLNQNIFFGRNKIRYPQRPDPLVWSSSGEVNKERFAQQMSDLHKRVNLEGVRGTILESNPKFYYGSVASRAQGGTLDNDQAEFTKYLVKVLKPKDKKDFEVKMSKLSEQEVGELYKQYKSMDKGIIAKLGAKIDYIRQLNGTCPEGMEVASFGKGGCVKCKQKAEQKPMPVKKRITDTKKKC